ncbi:NAD-dependent epimerase/dehydratase family protein [Tepidamorphus sp. 3E244]|uniref:NAD-dependent epimerase/dehydratase family protein n=1 Tax=Tepidamorphus sp. 3E244 TaxID=3385498 RepID=UPI0038FC54BF
MEAETFANRNVLVTGGGSFIGSHMVEALIDAGAHVRVVDNLSSGRIEYLRNYIDPGAIEFVESDLKDPTAAREATRDVEFAFHLAADHGGRGYIETHESACASNVLLDSTVFEACARSGVKRVVFASSGCIYPANLQGDAKRIVKLREDEAGPPYDPDGIYGWAKLTGEKTLAAYGRDHGMDTVSCRYFTAYGPRATESHAVIAMIARAFVGQDPFEVWGTGEQVRNWTYVSDIVSGTLAAAARGHSGEAYNVGTMEGTRVIDAARMVLERAGLDTGIRTLPDKPTGPYYRICDNAKLRNHCGWSPQVAFADGLARTMDWYFETRTPAEVRERLPELLMER